MGMKLRAAGIIAIVSVPVALLAGCGGSSGAGATGTLARIQPTSFVTQLPATTTTTTTTIPTEAPVQDGTQISEGEQVYIVVAGDSVSRIATVHGVDANVLATYNQWADGINHLIIPGDPVLIPPGGLIPATVTTIPGIEAAEPEEPGCTYIIEAGDNPSKVADKFGVSVLDLQGINSESVMRSFLVGATLVIPPGGDCDQ